MSIHYLVTAYGNQRHLLRLLHRLTEADPAGVSVQWDESKGQLHRDVTTLGVNVIRPNFPIAWGDASYFDALLGSLGAIPPADWLVVLSGQDYPIRPVSMFQTMLDSAAFDGILHLTPVVPPGQDPRSDDQRRYYFRHLWTPAWLWRIGGGARGIGRMLHAATSLPGMRRGLYFRTRPRGLPGALGIRVRQHLFVPPRMCRKGADYFALRWPLVEELLLSARSEPDLLRHFRRSAIPTEGWFGTVLGHHGDSLLADVLHFTRFEGRSNPRVLELGDLDDARASGKFFARKFTDDSTPVVDCIDRELLAGCSRPTT